MLPTVDDTALLELPLVWAEAWESLSEVIAGLLRPFFASAVKVKLDLAVIAQSLGLPNVSTWEL